MDGPPIGPYPHPPPEVQLRPWNPAAPIAAARVIALIAERLPDTVVEHVGSSSVPGCTGKSCLDFAIPYRDSAQLDEINNALFTLGFQRQRNRDPFPETRPMRTGTFAHGSETFTLHMHVVPASGPEMGELRDFRDRLRADPVLVQRYVAAKRAIIDAGIRDGVDYARAKSRFIAELGFQGAEDD
jgi:dephospho-CoA kinase